MDLNSAQTTLLMLVMASNVVLALTSWKHKRESTEQNLGSDVARLKSVVDEKLVEIREDSKGLHERWHRHADEIQTLMMFKAVSVNDRESIRQDLHNAYRRIERLERMRGHVRADDLKRGPMSVPHEQLERAIAAARVRESQGYFTKVAAGDQRAASLFVRLVALDLNPRGMSSDFGWLSKMPGEAQVDGFAEDAICYDADPENRENAIDMVNGAGAPGASIGGAIKPRRENNRWIRPAPLSQEQLDYLHAGAAPPAGMPDYEALGGDAYFRSAVGVPLAEDMKKAGPSHGGGPLNDGSSVWFARPIFRILHAYANGQTPDKDAIIKSVRNEWRAVLTAQGATGLEPLP